MTIVIVSSSSFLFPNPPGLQGRLVDRLRQLFPMIRRHSLARSAGRLLSFRVFCLLNLDCQKSSNCIIIVLPGLVLYRPLNLNPHAEEEDEE